MRPSVIWLTGLSEAGKTSIANKLANELRTEHCKPIVLDGELMRTILQVQGYDEATRKEYNRVIARLASYLQITGHTVIVALISPYKKVRDEAREICNNFFEIYVATDLKTCIERDSKGLYAKAMLGEISNVTGISAPYEPPVHPELVLNAGVLSVTECVAAIVDLLGHKPEE